MYLVEKIIDKCENSQNDWRQDVSGGRSLKINQKEYDACGKSKLVREALTLERSELVQIRWLIRGSDIEKISYRLEDMGKFYEILNRERDIPRPQKQELIRKYEELMSTELAGILTVWIRRNYGEILKNLKQGKIPKMLNRASMYLPCFQGLDDLNEPVYKRIFSRKYLQNSKTFELEAEPHIIAKAREYCGEIEAEMNDTEVLSQLFIEEYSQELALKGPLKICIYKGEERTLLDLAEYFYGTVLNSETLKNSAIEDVQPDIRRVITIENKANFISAQYEKGTLYIFTHGYLSPRERDFLKTLEVVLADRDIDFYHSGDLDYGGVKIYEYMKTKIFTRLKPLMMDVEIYERYQTFGEQISAETMRKLEKTKIPDLQFLIEKMVEAGLGIEQESFLI